MIPINDSKRLYDKYQNEFETKLLEVARSGWYILGQEVSNFEKEFAEKLGVNYCVGVANGLDAITLGIKSLGIGEGDEVLVQANTYIATVLGISLNMATPVFVEPDAYYNMDCCDIENRITKKTKAILITHLYGQATSNIDKILEICKKYNLFLIEDCAQAHFAKYKGRNVGTFGSLGFFSYYPTKNLGAFGDAGSVVTNNEELAILIKKLRNYGSIVRYDNEIQGHNSRLDEIQAGFLRVKLAHYDEIVAERKAIAKRYTTEINNKKIELPMVAKEVTSVWHLFIIKVEEREKFRKYMLDNGIKTDVHYPIPPHLSKAYKNLNHQKGDYPITENMVEHIVTIPLFNGMTKDEIDKIIKVMNAYE